jgi:hypothetical protein
MGKKSSYRVPPRTHIGYGKPPKALVAKKRSKSKHDDHTLYVILAILGGLVYVDSGIVTWLLYLVIAVAGVMYRNTRRKGADGSVPGSRG